MEAETLEIVAPSRLHFGLLARHPDLPRQFGGLGLMVSRPRLRLRVQRASDPAERGFTASGSEGERAARFAEMFVSRYTAARQDGQPLARSGSEPIHGARLKVLSAPPAHVGLGSGTQLGMAVARVMAALHGLRPQRRDAPLLAEWVGRGRRSAVGVHGSMRGGLLLEGGKPRESSEAAGSDSPTAYEVSPLIGRYRWPEAWRVVLVCPRHLTVGPAGVQEVQAFAQMPPIPVNLTERMCRVVLLGLLPALQEQDITRFGEAVAELEAAVGACFQPAQGGAFADPLLVSIADHIRSTGVTGVGQSSWGPTLYAIVATEAEAQGLADELRARFDLPYRDVWVSQGENRGSQVHRTSAVGSADGPATPLDISGR